MDSGSWTRISSFSRRHQPRSDAYHGEDHEVEDEQRPEFLCPFCADNFDVVGLCCHIDEEHAVEAKNGICPVCAKTVGSDLVRHLTVQHGNILKVQRRRKLRRGGSKLSLRKELREGNVQSLLGGSLSRAEPDPLLSSFINNPPVVDEPSNIKSSSSDASLIVADSLAFYNVDCVSQQATLSDEDLIKKAKRCEFVQGVVLAMFLDDEN